MAVARLLYRDGASYWEVYVRTVPLDPSPPADPADPRQLAAQGAAVTAVTVVVATEIGPAVARFRQGGHPHEEAVATSVARLLQGDFPRAGSITMTIFFGETHEHAIATWRAGALDYRVLDGI